MNTYTLSMFLLTEASVSRITNTLLQAGFGVKPACSNDRTHIPGKVTTFLCVKITCEVDTLIEVSPFLIKLFSTESIPYFGYTLECEKTRSVRISTGYLPATKAKKNTTPPAEPKRGGQVISLAEYKKKPN
jgi:hypothetical protein